MDSPLPAATRTDDHAARAALPDAVLWDMDGTLVDTEPYWMAAETAIASRHGATWTHEQGLALVGKALPDSARIILEQTGIPLEPDALVSELVGRVAAQIHEHGAPWQPGAWELLTSLRDAGVPCAIVTMSYVPLAEAIVDVAPAGVFGAIVTGDQVARGKPHPEAYLTAAERLGVDVTRCVAVEDSATGMEAAYASGARTIGVPHMVSVPARPGLSRLRSLAHADVALLARIVAGEVVDELAG